MALPMLSKPVNPMADPMAQYLRLRDAGALAAEKGSYEEALPFFESALDLAQSIGDSILVDRAFCNRATVAIALGTVGEEISELRAILMRDQDGENSRLCAYHIAWYFMSRKSFKKALFYARIALDRSILLNRREWVASSHNRIGNVLIAESYFDEACTEYDKALALSDTMSPVDKARLLDNIGYCRIIEKRYSEGFELLYRSLRTLRRFDAECYLVHLDLCLAHLEVGRWRDARCHGETALTRARQLGRADVIKNSLYLLGQTASMSGAGTQAAGAYFAQLQDYFPNAPFLTEFLLSIDVRKMINLKA